MLDLAIGLRIGGFCLFFLRRQVSALRGEGGAEGLRADVDGPQLKSRGEEETDEEAKEARVPEHIDEV